MKEKLIPFLILVVLISNLAFAQSNRTPEKIKQDSIESANFKIKHPELHRFKRLPINLIDGNYYVPGYLGMGIRVTNNHLIDSINHNFHQSARGEGTIPYNNTQVTEGKLSLDIIWSNVFTEILNADSALIIQIDEASVKSRKIDNKPISKKGPFMLMGMASNYYNRDTITVVDFKGDSTEIRISINGKLLFDWTPLNKFTLNTFKFADKWPAPNEKMKPFWVVQYGQGYHIADENLNINDQLLVEIKSDKNGWMMDRFNFIRVAATPSVSSIIPTDEQNKALAKEKTLVLPDEKKTSFLTPIPKK
jgi:hypothetical protein